tara:strand:- start:826 stop:1281 length:456 start_codon:yes stop_codon:yes gene_type:complete
MLLTRKLAICTLLVTGALTAMGNAGTALADNRYTMTETEDGFVRLDNETGKLSHCREKSGGFVCELAADERAAYEAEILALTQRLEKLEGKSPAERAGVPTEEEIDEAFGFFESMAKRFARAARVFGKEMQQMDDELSRDPSGRDEPGSGT